MSQGVTGTWQRDREPGTFKRQANNHEEGDSVLSVQIIRRLVDCQKRQSSRWLHPLQAYHSPTTGAKTWIKTWMKKWRPRGLITPRSSTPLSLSPAVTLLEKRDLGLSPLTEKSQIWLNTGNRGQQSISEEESCRRATDAKVTFQPTMAYRRFKLSDFRASSCCKQS